MLAFPPAKINLGLNVISKREDGYHTINTCFYPIGWTDVLEIVKGDEFRFTQSGLNVDIPGADNLCVKAYKLLATTYTLGPVQMHLHKVIPAGAGLGGGSADAAFTLKMLNDIFDLKLNNQILMQYASVLGSDCAFFVDGQPALGKGRGDELSPFKISLKDKFIVVVKPEIHISTAEAYAGLAPKYPEVLLEDVLSLSIANWKEKLKNDFELSIFEKYPEIKKIKEHLYANGAIYASLSGSGAAVYGIFDKEVYLPEFNAYARWSGFASF